MVIASHPSSIGTDSARTLLPICKQGLSEVSSGGETPDLDIVFVHGLKGHPEHTWTAKPLTKPANSNRLNSWVEKKFKKTRDVEREVDQMPCFWPRDLLAADIPGARIYTYGYDSSPSNFFNGPANKSSVHSYGRDLLIRLASVRGQCRGRPLIFIAHSLGGLVVKSTLFIASDEYEENEHLRDISKSTIAVLFFGTPHRGSQWVNAGKILGRFAKILGFSVSDQNLDLLTPNNPLLETLRDNFVKRLERDRLKVTSFQEQMGYTGINGLDGLIVEPDSSAIDHRKENRQAIHANHLEMCKFWHTGETHQTYEQLVLSEIRRYIAGIEDEVKTNIAALESFRGDMDIRREQIEEPFKETFSWLLLKQPKGPGLMEWLSRTGQIYWIQGLPGSGKSTAMKMLVRSEAVKTCLSNAGWWHASMFLSDRIGPANRSFKGVLGAMLCHLLEKEGSKLRALLRSFIVPRHSAPTVVSDDNLPEQETPFNWTLDRLKNILLQCKGQTLVEFSSCFFIDALDEYDKSELSGSESNVEFLEKLVSVDGQGLGRFKLCVSSRPDNEFHVSLSHYPGFRMQDWTTDDISSFVVGRLQSHWDAMSSKSEEYDRNLGKICKTIIKESHGLFIWVRLVVQDVWDGMTNGRSLEALLKALELVPQGELPELYLHILRKRPKETLRQTYAVLETAMRAQHPVSVLDIGILLETLSVKLEDLEPIARHFSSQQLLRLSNNGKNLERNLKNLTGGLLQVVRENEQVQTNMLPKLAASSSAHGVHAPTWKVQFLHQTVKEFLQSRDFKQSIDDILREQPGGLSDDNRMDNGHTFHLKLAVIASGVHLEAKKQAMWKLDPMKTVIYHAPPAEKLTGRSFFHVLNRLDNHFSNTSSLRENWALDYAALGNKTWVPTFLAYAVSSDMRLFVADALINDKSALLEKKGRPLLHFAGWVPSGFPNHKMARILLNQGAKVNREFDETERYGWSKTALESIQYHDLNGDGQSHCDYIKLLIKNGAKTSRRTDESWTTVLHAIASMKVAWDKKMDIIQTIPKRCDLNDKDRDGKTVFELLIQSAVNQKATITERDLQMLLEQHGARITQTLALQICESRLPTSIHSLFQRTVFLKPGYYDTRAEKVMREHKYWNKSFWDQLKRLF